jgi:hypothetical protein
MKLTILSLTILASLSAAIAVADDDVLDSDSVRTEYPTLIKRLEKRDRDGKLVCGLVIRCKLPSEKECRMQYVSELIPDGVYTVAYDAGTSQVQRGHNGSLNVKGTIKNDVRKPVPGMPAPTMIYSWDITGSLNYDDSKKLFTFVQKQSVNQANAILNGKSYGTQGFDVDDIAHCSGAVQVAP